MYVKIGEKTCEILLLVYSILKRWYQSKFISKVFDLSSLIIFVEFDVNTML